MSSNDKPPVAQVANYRIMKLIATGGMSSVYKACDIKTGKLVALKILDLELAKNPILIERFHREAKHASILSHKNIVAFYESGHADNIHYLVMELVSGIDLGQYIRRKVRIDTEESRRIILQACKALNHAHEHGLIHRDIKPSNFLLADDRGRCRVKLADLGLSRMENEEDYRVTRAGTTVGTVDYMSPEQARDAGLADIRSDIYSLGCTFYHMLAGSPPFAEGGIGERVYRHIAVNPPDIRDINSQVSTELWEIIRRMLAKRPEDRFQTPNELLTALRALTKDSLEFQNSQKPVQPESIETPTPTDAPEDLQSPSSPLTRTRLGKVTTTPDIQTNSEKNPDVLGITAEQKQAASEQFTYATEVLRSQGGPAYAQELLLAAVKLDPTNLLYRKMLREVIREHTHKGGWFTALSMIHARSRLRAAIRANEYRLALELGEEILVRRPGDISTQVEMAESAEALGLHGLAMWLLQEAISSSPKNLNLLRSLASLLERQENYRQAIEVLVKIRQLTPSDFSVNDRIKNLAVTETIARTLKQDS